MVAITAIAGDAPRIRLNHPAHAASIARGVVLLVAVNSVPGHISEVGTLVCKPRHSGQMNKFNSRQKKKKRRLRLLTDREDDRAHPSMGPIHHGR